jgi:hypothetical protein
MGQAVGWIILLQMAIAAIVYFRLMTPLRSPDGLVGAAPFAPQLRLAGVLLLLPAFLSLAAAVTALPVFRQRSERMAFVYLALCTVGVATLAAETVAMRSVLALSLEYAKTGTSRELLEVVRPLVRGAWLDAHYTNLVLAHATLLFFGVLLFRLALVPRLLTGLSIAASVVSLSTAAMPLLGYPFNFRGIAPMAMVELAMIAWLIIRGFDDRTHAAAGQSASSLSART